MKAETSLSGKTETWGGGHAQKDIRYLGGKWAYVTLMIKERTTLTHRVEQESFGDKRPLSGCHCCGQKTRQQTGLCRLVLPDERVGSPGRTERASELVSGFWLKQRGG